MLEHISNHFNEIYHHELLLVEIQLVYHDFNCSKIYINGTWNFVHNFLTLDKAKVNVQLMITKDNCIISGHFRVSGKYAFSL